MNFNELQAILQNLTNKCFGVKKIEEHLGISIYQSGVYSGERQNDTAVDEKSSQFGSRLSELQAQHS